MIYVDRSRVPAPAEIEPWRDTGIARLAEFFRLPKTKRTQRKPPFIDPRKFDVDLISPLMKLFRSKCGYCETPLSEEGDAVVDWFRPRSRAKDEGSRIFPEHYSWLAYEWSNLVLSCKVCARYKGTSFPVAGSRAKPQATGDALLKEKALIVDPCEPPDYKTFQFHLSFELDGTVRSLSRRGEATIKVLNLNRSQLVTARNRAAAEVDGAFRGKPLRTKKQRDAALSAARKLASDDQPYSAARQAQFDLLVSEVVEWDKTRKTAEPDVESLPPVWADQYGAAVWLRRIEIENFRVIHELALDFPEPQVGANDVLQEPWIMLLGENGVGKSSILKATALALTTPAARRRIVPFAGSLFNRRVKKGNGAIRLFFSGSDEPLELSFSRNSEEFKTSGVTPRLPVRAYGSTRLLPLGSNNAQRARARRAQIDNLFDPRSPLSDAQVWLADTGQVNYDRFHLLATSLKTLLSLGEEEKIYRRSGELFSRLGQARVSIREFSDGYQSLFAMTTDLMLHLSSASFDMENVEGLVFLDEIEVHLHPQWKIEVVGKLRELFPKVRFLVTTHDPLCLHGLKDGEVHVLGRDADTGRVECEQVDVPPGLRADQLLTGFWFGLNSTRDDETIDKMRRHGELILLRSPTAKERKERQQLESELDERLHGFDRLELESHTKKMVEVPVRRSRTKAEKQALREKILGLT